MTREVDLLVVKNFRLTTAEIIYHMPDCPALLQSYIWQDYDQAPTFPTLKKFLTFWQSNLEGKVHSVRLAHKGLVTPAEFAAIGFTTTLQ